MSLFGDEGGSAMRNVLLGMVVSMGLGAVVTAISGGYGGGVDVSDPSGGPVQAPVYQGKAIAELQGMGKATIGFFLDAGRYPEDLQELLNTPHGKGMGLRDPWGNPWLYRAEGGHFLLLSYGSDGARGPKPPADWNGSETAPDLIIKDGAWLQAPQRDLRLRVGAQ